MKTQLLTFKSMRNSVLFLVLLACSALVSGQQTQHNSATTNLKAPRVAQLIGNRPAPHAAHFDRQGGYSRALVCDTDLFMDYAAYDEVFSELNGLHYNGSWYTGTNGLYLNGMTSYNTIASGDSGYVSYAGVIFDSLLFSNPIDTTSGYLPLATSTVYFDSLGLYESITGDSTRMTNDSVVILIYSITNGTLSATPVKSLVYTGWAQLKQFYTAPGYVNYLQLPVHYPFSQGQGMAILMKYRNKRTGNLLSLAYSYPDSCGTVVYAGNTYNSPAYPPVLAGNEFYGEISRDTAGIVHAFDNTAGYFTLGFPASCSNVYTQNWAIMPIVTVCAQANPVTVTTAPTNVNCFGQSTGSATATPSGGTGTFTYAWSNGATSSSISNVAAGTYTVTVTSGGVTATATATVTQPASALTTTPSSTQTICSSNTGTATANAAGGTAGYTYLWSNGATLASISGLGAATYTLTVTDSKGCSVTGSTTVSRPAAFSVSVSVTNVTCFGQSTGSATATATGATGNLTYTWNNGSTQTISNLPAGNYNVTVTDANGCSSSASASVSQSGTAVTASATSTQTNCGSGTGTATVTAGGGTPGYTYSWSNTGTSITITNLPVGNYNVTVTDSHSCTASASTSVNTSATFVVNVSSTDVNCFGQSTGTATASVTGATGTVIYVWSNASTSQNLTGLAAGTYNVTVTDASACPKTSSVTIAQPSSALAASVTTNPTGCSSNSGSATASVSGGTPSYTYAWSNSNTSNPVSGLAAGSVSVTVTDSKGCSVTGSGNVATPPSFTVSTTPTSVSCNGQSSGSVNSAVTGNGTYTYFWSNGSTSSTITNVTAGQYSLTVTDAFGCTATSSSTVNQPSVLQVSATSTDANSGHNGTATAGATGGTTPYQFSWSNGGTTLAITGLAAGTYTVTITDANNCSGSATTTIIATDINSVASNITSITLIPNPANDVVKVVVSLGNAQTVDVRLVDLAGKYIYTAHESAFQGTITHQINVGEYAAGIYLVEITAGNEVMRRKLVITK